MPLIARVLFHHTPCCRQDIHFEYPPDMRDNEELEMSVHCAGCGKDYNVVLRDFRRGSPHRATWYDRAEVSP